ncbi:MAG: RDD family protein [Candidatus Thorarchaeota archaeon]
MVSVARVLSIFFGIILLITSFGLLIGGTAIIVVTESLTDSEGYINTPIYPIQSSASALTFSSLKIGGTTNTNDNGVERWFSANVNPGDFVKIRIKADGMFIGIAKSSDVLNYLSGVSYLEVKNIGFNSLDTIPKNSGLSGNLTANPPTNQTQFSWLHSGTSVLNWAPQNNETDLSLAVVIMNPDGSSGLNIEVSAGAQIPILRAIGIALLVFGIIIFIVSIVLFVIAAKSKRRPRVDRYRIYRDPAPPIVKTETPNVRYCANCGSQIDIDSRFCSACGEPVLMEGAPSAKAIASSQTSTISQAQYPASEMTPQAYTSIPSNAYVVASYGTRFWAFLIDAILITAVIESIRWLFIYSIGYWSYTSNWFIFGFGFSLNAIAMLFYFGFCEGKYSTTLGKQALGLMVVNENGQKANFGEAFVSAIGKAFLLPIDLLIGYFIQDPPVGKNVNCNQRLFQRISKTITVHTPPPGSEPTDQFLSSKIYR